MNLVPRIPYREMLPSVIPQGLPSVVWLKADPHPTAAHIPCLSASAISIRLTRLAGASEARTVATNPVAKASAM